MDPKHIHYLHALRELGTVQAAAQACGLSPTTLRAELAPLQTEYGMPLLNEREEQLTPTGLQLADWGARLQGECDQLRHEFSQMRMDRTLAPLLQRRSVSPKRLKGPGPDDKAIERMVDAALCAPDHGGVHPWRLLKFREEDRATLAQLFEDEKRRRDPMASADDLARAREHALRCPTLLAFIVSPQLRHAVPVREQWLGAGAALGNLLNAVHQLGFGAILLSGERCYDTALKEALDVKPHEFLAGFISLGTVAAAPPARKKKDPKVQISVWTPQHATHKANA
jgi:nitroreductase